MSRPIRLILVTVLFTAVFGVVAAKENYVHMIGRIDMPRAGHTATLLRSGTVLIAGGMQEDGEVTASTLMYLPASMEFRSAPEMTTRRTGHTATMLNDHRILMLGGFDANGPVTTAEVYHTMTPAFESLSDAPVSGTGFTATKLNDGRVLITGGGEAGAPHAESYLFDPETDTFTPTTSLVTPRAAHIAVLLDDGRVWIAGGTDGKTALASTEIYDPATGEFAASADLLTARCLHGVALLSDGRVLVVGGANEDDWSAQISSTEIFDPASGLMTRAGNMHYPRFRHASSMTALENGTVLIAGGDALEVFHPDTGRFEEIQGGLSVARIDATATRLSNGHVLIVGGQTETQHVANVAWLYLPPMQY